MFSSGCRNIIQLISFLLFLHVIFAAYDPSYGNQRHYALNNQRSADSGYKYAWFTRDIHDDTNSDEENNIQEQPLFPSRLLHMKMAKNILNKKYQNINDENLSESNGKL